MTAKTMPSGAPRRLGGRGYTLVEVLITTAVMLVALSGMVSIQTLSVRAVSSTYHRTQAVTIAYRISDAMRANRGDLLDPRSALSGVYNDLRFCRSDQRHSADQRTCTVDLHDPLSAPPENQLPLFVADWWRALNGAGLPNWYAVVQRVNPNVAADRRFRVVVQWDDHRVEQRDASTDTKTSCLGTSMPRDMQEVCLVTEI